jgi:hypothetical protein
MARVALLTMSDGRDFVARDLTGYGREAEDAVAAALEASGHQVERDLGTVTSARQRGAGRMHVRGDQLRAARIARLARKELIRLEPTASSR